MNKNELIEALAPRLGGRAAAALAVESLVDVVLRQVAAGGSVAITGFGAFETVDRAPRTGRNPHTGDAVPIPATRVPRFRPGTYFRTVVAEPSRLPAEGLAGARVGSADDDAPGEDEAVPDGRSASAAGGHGVPPSIRRPAAARRDARPARPARRSSERGAEGPGRRRPGGAPATVRADRSRELPAPSAEPTREPAPGDRLTIGGEQITREMISAKKAQLARAQSDDRAEGSGGTGTGAAADGRGSGSPQGKGKAKGKGKGKGKGAGSTKDKKKDKKKGKKGGRKDAAGRGQEGAPDS